MNLRMPKALSRIVTLVPDYAPDVRPDPVVGILSLVQEFTSRLRESTGRLHSLTRLGGRLPSAAGPLPLPLPGALSAAQLTAVADSIAAQRRGVEALKAQLSSFDEQLKALEQILGPLAEWSRTWAEFEQRLLSPGRGPETDR
jgi:hypothetical protein